MRNFSMLLALAFALGCGDDDGPTDSGADAADTSIPSDTGSDSGTDAGDVDATMDAGDDAGEPDSGPPARDARLVVGDSTGLSVFYTEDIDRDETPAADVTVATTTVAGLAVIGDRLFVAHPTAGDGISVFDDAYDITAGATAIGTIPHGGTTNSQPVDPLTADDAGSIYLFEPSGAFHRYADATGALPTAAAATFSHPFTQVHGFAIDTVNDRAFGGQISGAGVQAWNDASSATGATEPDFQVFAGCTSWAMAVSGTRLFAGCVPMGGRGTVQIWDDIASLTDTTPPDVTLEMDVDGTAGSIWDVTIGSDSIFVASDAGLRVWNDASTIDAPRAPDFIIDTGAIQRVAHASDGTLYTLGRPSAGGNVTIIRESAAPDVWTTLTMFTDASDIVIIE